MAEGMIAGILLGLLGFALLYSKDDPTWALMAVPIGQSSGLALGLSVKKAKNRKGNTTEQG